MGLLDIMESQKRLQGDNKTETPVKKTDTFSELKDKVQNTIIEEVNKQAAPDMEKEAVRKLIDNALGQHEEEVPRSERKRLSNEIFNDVMGYGPIEELLADPDVSEIMVNGPHKIYVEKKGKLELSGLSFRDDQHVINVIDRIVTPIGRHIDEASPMVDARLPDGSRVNAIIPPISLIGPVITIRKFSKKPFTTQDLIRFGSATPRMLNFLEACVKGRLNIVVSGGTGSGKTTLLNVLSSYISENERIVTVEDAAEIKLNQEHVVTLESRPANLEGKGQISIRDLVRNALRMRPDRIIVGEVRSGEALDMLQAMNTGHDGSMTTAHSNSPRDTISRLETMVMMSGLELPLKAIRDQISSAVDLIVHQTRLRDGTRKITNITEVTGMEGDIVSMQDIFTYETEGQLDSTGKFKGRFRATGVRPNCLEKIRENGVPVNNEWFGD